MSLLALSPPSPKCGEDAVLADERHDVGDRAERGERGRLDEERAERLGHPRRAVHRLPDAPRELERHAGAAEVRVRIRLAFVARQPRVDDGEAVGQPGAAMSR